MLDINRIFADSTTILSTTISLSVDALTTKISVNDVVLANAILGRAKISTAAPTKQTALNSTDQNPSSDYVYMSNGGEIEPFCSENGNKGVDTRSVVTSITVYDCIAQVGPISFTAVNDYQGHPLPVLRVQIEKTDFHAGGAWDMNEVIGDASLTLSIEYYNSRISVWEPFLER